MQRLQSLDLEAHLQETMQCSEPRVELISDAATLDCWGFLLSSTSRTPKSLHEVSCGSALHAVAWSPLLTATVSYQGLSSTKMMHVCVLKEKGTCSSVCCALTWTASLDDANHPSATCPSTDSISKATCRKKLGSLGSLVPLHLIDAAVLNHRFKACLASEWLQAICHFEATLQIFSEIGLMLPVSSWHRLSTCRGQPKFPATAVN